MFMFINPKRYIFISQPFIKTNCHRKKNKNPLNVIPPHHKHKIILKNISIKYYIKCLAYMHGTYKSTYMGIILFVVVKLLQ